MRVRAAAPADIPAIVRLRARAYARTAQSSPEAAEAYMRRILFENPWREGALPSLVAEDGGDLVAFIGVLTRPMTLDGRAIRMAVPTQLMADPDKGALAGLLLLRQVMGGEQELTVADAANGDARRIWEKLGGATCQLYSTVWTAPVRPLRAAAIGWGSSPPARLARLLTKPLALLGDAVRAPARLGDLELAPLDGATAAGHLAEVAPRRGLVPRYEPESFAWLLDRVRDQAAGAEVLARAVRAGGALLGWYVAVAGPTHANLLQLAALPGRYADVLRAARADARRAGAVFLSHRYDPLAVDSWTASGARLERRGPWTLVHGRDPRAERAVLVGDAFLTRLEGEAWLSF